MGAEGQRGERGGWWEERGRRERRWKARRRERGIEGQRDREPAKGIGDGDGKLWIVERRPLDSELSGEARPERDMRDTIGFSRGILRISETELNTRGTRRATEEITSELVKRP